MAIMIWNKNSWASIVISSVGGNDYRIHFWFMSKSESMNSTKNGSGSIQGIIWEWNKLKAQEADTDYVSKTQTKSKRT